MTSGFSIVLPVHNQEDHLAALVEGYEKALARVALPHELLLVTNGCSDRSVEIAQELERRSPQTVRWTNSERKGWGAAVRHGIGQARYSSVCYTNSARTSPQDLTLFLLYSHAYPDIIVKANRKIRESWLRRLGSLLYNIECRALFGLPQWDINGTPKVFPKSFTRLFELTRDDDLIDLEFNVMTRIAAYPMIEVPIISFRRHGGRSTTRFGSAFRMYWGALLMWRRMKDALRER